MSTPAEHLSALMLTHTGTSGWARKIGESPKTPDRIMVFSDTGGPPPNPRYALDFPTVQASIRGVKGAGYAAARAEAKAVKDILLGITSQTMANGDRLVSVTLNSDIAYIGRDENERPLFTVNFALIIEPVVVANMSRVAL